MEDKKEDLLEKTVKELQAMVVELGMTEEEASYIGVKKPLIAIINTLRAKNVTKIAVEDKDAKKKWLSKKETMREKLMNQKKIRTHIPCEGKEKKGIVKWVYNKQTKREEQVYVSGTVIPVQLNGYIWLVPKGVHTELPIQVADMLADSQDAVSRAGEKYLIDRDEKVQENLTK